MKNVIIVAGGKGLRMGGDIPKQFIPVNGKPVLMHTLENFYSYDNNINIILVLPVDHQDYWKSLCCEYSFSVPHCIADGGETRFHSVKNGLDLINDNSGVVGVHDGVRPFVSHEVIDNCFSSAELGLAAVPVIDVVETVRFMKDEAESVTVPRDKYKLVQTPQVFPVSMLKNAYNQPYTPDFTDDASVVEAMGVKVTLVKGNRENIKLTTPFDLKIAEVL